MTSYTKIEIAVQELQALKSHAIFIMPKYVDALQYAINILGRVDVMERMANAMIKDLAEVAERDTNKAS